ncbi:hypothetical protein [Ensifer sp. B1-9]|uniref:hypothetical protein n=1 Tax=Ensifer sp. B1-9 TaxID=3141455 RepID=UPI003D20A667
MVMFEVRSIAPASRAGTVTAEMTQQGKPVRYLRSTFVPSEEKSFCLLDALSAERVREQPNWPSFRCSALSKLLASPPTIWREIVSDTRPISPHT